MEPTPETNGPDPNKDPANNAAPKAERQPADEAGQKSAPEAGQERAHEAGQESASEAGSGNTPEPAAEPSQDPTNGVEQGTKGDGAEPQQDLTGEESPQDLAAEEPVEPALQPTAATAHEPAYDPTAEPSWAPTSEPVPMGRRIANPALRPRARRDQRPKRHAPEHSATRRRSWMWLSVLLATVLGVAGFVGIVGAILYNALAHKMQESTLDISQFAVVKEEEPQSVDMTPDDSFHGRPVNILLMGIDSRTDQDISLVNKEDDDPTIRSDTTLLLHIAEDRESATIVSIPRDLWVHLPDCQRADGSTAYGYWGQFNWAFSQGAVTNDLGAGVACTTSMVENLTGVEPDGFAVIDFTGFSRMIEALGGVDICLEEDLADDMYLHFELEAGCHRLDPITATQYARVRYVGDGSDMARIQRQQGMLGSMAMEALDSNLLTDLPSLYAFMATAIESTKVSPSLSSLWKDAGLANSMKNIEPENIRFTTMPVLTADFDANRLLPKEPANALLWQSIIEDQPLPPGTVFMDINNEYFTVEEDGTIAPGGSPRTDNEIGYFNPYDSNY